MGGEDVTSIANTCIVGTVLMKEGLDDPAEKVEILDRAILELTMSATRSCTMPPCPRPAIIGTHTIVLPDNSSLYRCLESRPEPVKSAQQVAGGLVVGLVLVRGGSDSIVQVLLKLLTYAPVHLGHDGL